MVIFHCYVSLPEGMCHVIGYPNIPKSWMVDTKNRLKSVVPQVFKQLTHSHLGLSEDRPSIHRYVIIGPIVTHTQRETLERGHSLFCQFDTDHRFPVFEYTFQCVSQFLSV